MTRNMNRAVVFDLDGTLVNSLLDICGLLNLLRQEKGLVPLPVDSIRPYIGKGAEHVVRFCFPGDDLQVFEMTEKYKEYYPRYPSMGGALYPGVESTLNTLRQMGFKLGIATNKPTTSAEVTLKHYLPQFRFDDVSGPERVSSKKPDPRHLLEVLARMGADPRTSFYIGDDPVDRATAEAAKVAFIPAGWGFGGVANEPRKFAEILKKISI